MILECLPIGLFGSNSYVIGEAGEGAVIDAGVDAKDVMRVASEKGLKIKYIILTHGHVDHIWTVDSLQEKTGAKVVIHESEVAIMADALSSGVGLMGKKIQFKTPDTLVKDGDVLELGGLKLEIMHTPGHTPGGICIRVGNDVFTGDTLFRQSIGRTDFPGGNYNEIISSIKTKLLKLDDNIAIHPGHMEASTIGFERKYNPFLR